MLDKLAAFVGLLFVVFWIAVIASWIGNVYKLTQCDFETEKSYKCEVLHGVGIIPILSIFTVWVDTDK